MRKIYLPVALLLVVCQACDSADATKLRAENHELKIRLAALGQDTTSVADALANVPDTPSDTSVSTSASPSLSLSDVGGSATPGATGASMWRVRHYQDKFGEATKEGYITTETPILGTFSNSATQDSELRVDLLLDANQDANIQLYEYARNNPVKAYSPDNYDVSIKGKDGKVMNLTATNYSDRLSFDKRASKKLHNAFLKGGKLQFVIRESERPTTIYNFTLENADGFLAARKELRGVK